MTTTCPDDYDFLDEVDSPEVLEVPKTRDGDYEFIIGSDEKEPDRGWLEHVKTISAPQKVAKTAMSMVYNHIMDSSPAELINPFALVGVIAQATLAAGVQEIHGKPPEIDYKEQIDEAKKRLEEGKKSFSDDQIRTVQSWITEAETRLKNYMSQKPSGTGITVPGGNEEPPKGKKEAPQVIIDSDDEFPYRYASWRREIPKPQVVIPRITFRNLIEGSKDSKNPKMELLEKTDPRLHSLLIALTEFVRFPFTVQSVDRDDVTKNIQDDPAMGSSVFINNLKDRAYMLVQSLKNPELKRVLLAISGPGTAKSTGCKLMFKWAKFPCCMLSGEAFRNMCAGKRDTYQVFIEWIAAQIMSAGVLGIGILLDDWHFAMEEGGPLDSENKSSRERFLLFVKNCGDSTQKSVVYVELANGRKFPLNFEYIHLAMTFNRIPEDLYEKVDAAIRSRYFNLNATYASAEDRLEMAYTLYIPQFKKAIAEKMLKDESEIQLDEEYCKECITKVVEADIAIFRDKFNCQHGIRGLADLLQIYKQHVLANIPDDATTVDPRCFDITTFDLKSAIQSIEDYSKGIDSETAKHENRAMLMEKLNFLREQIQNIPAGLAVGLNKTIGKLENKMDETIFNNLSLQISLYKNRVPLPDPKTVGEMLKQNFGYLKSPKEGEIDRFTPLERIIKAMYLRMASARKGKPTSNISVQVTYSWADPGNVAIFQTIGNILGKLPVLHVSNPEFVISNALNPQAYHITSEHPIRKLFDSKSELMIYAMLEKRQVLSVPKAGVKYGSFTYMYADTGEKIYLLTPKVAADIANVGNSGEISGLENCLLVVDEVRGKNKIDWNSILAEKFKSDLKLPTRIADMVKANGQPSADESIVTLLVNDSMYSKIQKWGDTQPNPKQVRLTELFAGEILNIVKEPVKTSDGIPIDLSGITFFFLMIVGGDHFPEETLRMQIGVPPIGGRLVHGNQYFAQKFKEIIKASNETKQLLGLDGEINVELTDEEREIFKALVEFDEKMATFAQERKRLHLLPMDIIARNIDSFVYRIQTRISDMFSLGIDFPTLKTFTAEWEEMYKPHIEFIEKDIKKEEKRILDMKEAEEMAEIAKKRAKEIEAITHAKNLEKLEKGETEVGKEVKETPKDPKEEKKN